MLSSIPRRTSKQSPWVCAQCRRRTGISQTTLTILPSPALHAVTTSYTSTRFVSSTNKKKLLEEQELKLQLKRAARAPAAQRAAEDEGNTASIVSKLLAGATGTTALYPPGQPPIPPVTKLPTKWATNPFLRPVIRDTIRKVYPHIEDLTPIQAKLLATLAKRMHLSANDIPGTGKSFALATWMLNLDRSTKTTTGAVEPTSTVLALVPNSDLAQQYYSWITNILLNSGSDAVQSNVSNFVQVLYRTNSPAEDERQKQLLTDSPNPHIIIGTPNRILDILASGVNSPVKLLDIDHLKLVVIDEADSLLDFEAKRVFNKPIKALRTKVPPTEQLLDYIFQNRNKKLVSPTKAKGEVNYIQIVSTSSSMSARSMRRWIEIEKRQWLSPFGKQASMTGNTSGVEGVKLGFAPNLSPVKPGDLVCPWIATMQREETVSGSILRKIHEGIKHHVIGYDMETGFLRDAPLTRFEMKEALTSYVQANKDKTKIANRKAMEKEKLGDGATSTTTDAGLGERKLLGDDGYPESISVPILEKLLKNDDWPSNVLVGLGSMASKAKFKLECERIGIHAEVLSFETWNARQDGQPIGRTDKHLASATASENSGYNVESSSSEADKRSRTTVWITDPVACAGLDSPGLTHAYLFHRVETTKDYIAYCGRVSRHPFPEHKSVTNHNFLASQDAQNRDAEAYGAPGRIKNQPPAIGKVVSVILEEVITPEEARAERIAEAGWVDRDRANERAVGLSSYDPDFRLGSGYRYGKGEKVVRIKSDRIGNSEEGTDTSEIGVPVVQIGSMFEKGAYLCEGVRREKIGCVVERYFPEGMEDRGMVLGDDDDNLDYGWGEDEEGEEDEEDEDGEGSDEDVRLRRRRKWGQFAEGSEYPSIKKSAATIAASPAPPTPIPSPPTPIPTPPSPPTQQEVEQDSTVEEPDLPSPEASIDEPEPTTETPEGEEQETTESFSTPASDSFDPATPIATLPTPPPSSLSPPIPPPVADDPTLTPEELEEYHKAQLEIVGAYDELAQLMGQVWDNTPKEVKEVVELEMEKVVESMKGELHESEVVGGGVEGVEGVEVVEAVEVKKE
ncbi:hypothetical protein DFH27DRAFT_136808 [Peziza echinospora]|nr:hypothetical protein DFH27DRAFT_136808 [Peziza echinospora]